MIPFTYLIGWSHLDKFYYGVRYGQGVHPDTLWTTYFTSSKDVRDYREKQGEPDIIQVRYTFTSVKSARDWEFKVLRRLHVSRSPRWLNRREAPGFPLFAGAANPMYGKKQTAETRAKISAKAKGRKWTSDQIAACQVRNTGERNPFYGLKHTAETKMKLRASQQKVDRFGSSASIAKTFLFTSPSGETHQVVGSFDKFCKANDISRTKMHLAINRGAIPDFIGNNMTTQQTRNAGGWSVSTIPLT